MGRVLINKLDQKESVWFLENMEKRTGWPMSALISKPAQQGNDSEDEFEVHDTIHSTYESLHI